MKQVIFCPKETRILIGDIKDSDILIAKDGDSPKGLIWHDGAGWRYVSTTGTGCNWDNLQKMILQSSLNGCFIYKTE